jgi:phospholipid N-methyltransferase
MKLIGNVDVVKKTEVSGWAADNSALDAQVWIDIVINSVPVASVSASLMRDDLLHAGLGNGRKAFRFDPSAYLGPGPNLVEVRFSGTRTVVPGGSGQIVGIYGGHLPEVSQDRLFELSQERWKGSEVDVGLTWGEIFTGDSFIDAVQTGYHFDATHHICEIGPGYGRLLKTILERKLPFRRYTGVELSEDRVRKLTEKFGNSSIRFVRGDVNSARINEPIDLVISSSTFEHLFPDFATGLTNLVKQLNPLAGIAIDFAQSDEAMAHRQQGFEPQGHAFVRVYSAEEIQSVFQSCGLRDVELRSIELGRAAIGDVKRIFAFARLVQSVQNVIGHT